MERRFDCALLFKQIHDSLGKRANNSLRVRGLTMVQMSVLVELSLSPEKQMALKEMERRLHVAQSTAAGIVARLEQKGFIESFGDAADRRIKMLRITPEGEACRQQADQNLVEAEAMLLRGLTEKEHALLLDLLKRVAQNLK